MSRPLTLLDREAVITAELHAVGYAEDPLGSNNTIYGRFTGTNFLAWCAAFQSKNHYDVLGFSPFPATSPRGSASCYAIEQYARQHGLWVDGDQEAERGDLGLLRWSPHDIVHHICLVTEPLAVRRYRYVAGNESDRVKTGTRSGPTIAGYVRLGYQTALPTPAQPPKGPVAMDLGAPPRVPQTLHPDMVVPALGPLHDAYIADMRYLKRGLNLCLPLWGHAFHTDVNDPAFNPETVMGLAAFKIGANNKQWQHADGHVARRMFIDVADNRFAAKTLQYLRFFGLLG